MVDIDNTEMKIMRFIQDFTREKQYSPTMREIGDHVGLKKTAASYRVHKLLRHKLLEMVPGAQRTITVSEEWFRLTGRM
jgi:SOS-response transcriptional repressor LexA